jgi:hypothetical protein
MNFTLFGFNFRLFQNTEENNYRISPKTINELGQIRAQLICDKARNFGHKMNLANLAVLRREHAPLSANFAEAMYVEHWDKRVYYNYFFSY